MILDNIDQSNLSLTHDISCVNLRINTDLSVIVGQTLLEDEVNEMLYLCENEGLITVLIKLLSRWVDLFVTQGKLKVKSIVLIIIVENGLRGKLLLSRCDVESLIRSIVAKELAIDQFESLVRDVVDSNLTGVITVDRLLSYLEQLEVKEARCFVNVLWWKVKRIAAFNLMSDNMASRLRDLSLRLQACYYGAIWIPDDIVRADLAGKVYDFFLDKKMDSFFQTYDLLNVVMAQRVFDVKTRIIWMFDARETSSLKNTGFDRLIFIIRAKVGGKKLLAGGSDGTVHWYKKLLGIFCEEVRLSKIPEPIKGILADLLKDAGLIGNTSGYIWVAKEGMTPDVVKALILRAVNRLADLETMNSSRLFRNKSTDSMKLKELSLKYIERSSILAGLESIREVARMKVGVVLTDRNADIISIRNDIKDIGCAKELFDKMVLEPIRNGDKIALDLTVGDLLYSSYVSHPVEFDRLYGGKISFLSESNRSGIQEFIAGFLENDRVMTTLENSGLNCFREALRPFKELLFQVKPSINDLPGNPDIVGVVSTGENIVNVATEVQVKILGNRDDVPWRVIKDYLKTITSSRVDKVMVNVMERNLCSSHKGILDLVDESELVINIALWTDKSALKRIAQIELLSDFLALAMEGKSGFTKFDIGITPSKLIPLISDRSALQKLVDAFVVKFGNITSEIDGSVPPEMFEWVKEFLYEFSVLTLLQSSFLRNCF